MRRPSPWGTHRPNSDLQLTPLIDVIFLLLVFFVWNVNRQPPEFELRSQIIPPRTAAGAGAAPVAAEADYQELVVRIAWREGQPSWTLGTQAVPDLETLAARLADVFAIHAAAPLVVHPDPEVPLGSVVDVYDRARQTGFREVKFTATAGAEP